MACLAFALVFFLSEKVVKCTSKEIPDGWGLARAYAEELEDSFPYDGMRREGRKLEKGVAKVGSMKVQFFIMEKGFEVSTDGAGIFSSISNIISCGKSFRLVLGLRFWPGGEVEVEGQCLGRVW